MKAKYIGIKKKILGSKWQIRFYTVKAYDKHKDTIASDLGCTVCYKKRIYISIRKKGLLDTIIHEMVHAYLAMLCIKTANVDSDDLEEIFCEFMPKHGMDLLLSSQEVYNDYLQLKDKVK